MIFAYTEEGEGGDTRAKQELLYMFGSMLLSSCVYL